MSFNLKDLVGRKIEAVQSFGTETIIEFDGDVSIEFDSETCVTCGILKPSYNLKFRVMHGDGDLFQDVSLDFESEAEYILAEDALLNIVDEFEWCGYVQMNEIREHIKSYLLDSGENKIEEKMNKLVDDEELRIFLVDFGIETGALITDATNDCRVAQLWQTKKIGN